MSIKQLCVGETIVPTIPFLWYREEQLLAPIEYAAIINKETFIQITKNLGYINMNDYLNAQDYTIMVQRNILEDVKMYMSYHSYIYAKDVPTNTQLTNLNPKYNKNHMFSIKTNSHGNNINHLKLKKDTYINCSVYIHNSAFSPAGVTNFTIDKDVKITSIISNAYCPKQSNANCSTIFVVINDTSSDDVIVNRNKLNLIDAYRNIDDLINISTKE